MHIGTYTFAAVLPVKWCVPTSSSSSKPLHANLSHKATSSG